MANAFAIPYLEICNKLKSEVTIHYDGREVVTTALWDTGATNSCISKDVVSGLNMTSTGNIPMLTPSGSTVCNTYLVDVTLTNKVYVPSVMVLDSEIGNQGIGMLIGMDIITKGDFAVSNYNGKTMFTFRMPSESTLNFVSGIKASNVIMANRTRKNSAPKKKR